MRLRTHRKEQRETRERNKILAWAKGESWEFSRQSKIPSKLHYPPQLDGETDRGRWGIKLGEYLTTLYQAEPTEVEAIHEELWCILDLACRDPSPPLECNPTELRDIIRSLPPHKAAGPDGIPSQILHALSFAQIKDLAKRFSELANTLDYRPPTRPGDWGQTLAMMIPKEAGAQTLDKHRAIALMCQLQKVYSKWLLTLIQPALAPVISEHQMGFRRHRQASELLHVVAKLIELAEEWKTPLTIVRLDMKKAFDRLKQSSILNTLRWYELPAKVVFNAARELIGTTMIPAIYGCSPSDPLPLEQGTKQGAPESGLFFIAALNRALAPLRQSWDAQGAGIQLDDALVHHLLFADDLILVGPSPRQVSQMINEVTPALEGHGLCLNPEKTSYLTTHPSSAHVLPGQNANQTGLKILGRTFTLSDNTQQDMDQKIAGAWGRFNRLRHILNAATPLPHRLRILKSCVGQSLLWASETWHITRRRLQRIRGVELAMMKTLIPCPYLAKDAPVSERCEAHKAHIRKTLKAHKYEGLDRVWVRKYFSWARTSCATPPERLARKALHTKSLAWWRHQQTLPQGHRHEKRRGNLSRWENVLGRHHPLHHNWPQTASRRKEWTDSFSIFEARVFGVNSPHDLVAPGTQNLPEKHPREVASQKSEEHPPPREKKGPRERRRPRPQSTDSGRDPKSRRVAPPHSPPTWEESLQLPLSSLLPCPQDGRQASRLRKQPPRQRDRLRRGAPSGSQATQDHLFHDQAATSSQGPLEGGASRERREQGASRPAGRAAASAATTHGDRSRASVRGPVSSKSDRIHRSPSGRPRCRSTSTSRSSSTSSSTTSTSSSSSKATTRPCAGQGQKQEQRQAKGRKQSDGGPGRVLQAAAAEAAAASSHPSQQATARQRQSKGQRQAASQAGNAGPLKPCQRSATRGKGCRSHQSCQRNASKERGCRSHQSCQRTASREKGCRSRQSCPAHFLKGKGMPITPVMPAMRFKGMRMPITPVMPVHRGGGKGMPITPVMPAQRFTGKGMPITPVMPAMMTGMPITPVMPALFAHYGGMGH